MGITRFLKCLWSDSALEPIEPRTKEQTRAQNFRNESFFEAEKRRLDARRTRTGPVEGGRGIESGALPGADKLSAPTDADRAARAISGIEGDYTGLAISGGGIRSATFALGLLQALARNRLLKHFDYLSTASGGGYVGSSVTWYLSEAFQTEREKDKEKGGNEAYYDDQSEPDAYGLDADDFPFKSAEVRDRANIDNWRGALRFLREHAEYLTPDSKIDMLSGIAVVLRGILLNLIVWVPIASAIFLLMFGKIGTVGGTLGAYLNNMHGAVDAVENSVLDGVERAADAPSPQIHTGAMDDYGGLFDATINFYEVFGALGIAAIAAFIALSIFYSLYTYLGSVVSTPLQAYDIRRQFEISAKYLIPVGVVLLLFGWLPFLTKLMSEYGQEMGGTGGAAVVAGISSALAGIRKSDNPTTQKLLFPVAAILLISGVLLLSCYIAVSVHAVCWDKNGPLDFIPHCDPHSAWVGELALGIFLLSVVTGFFVNTNDISLHRFYRDRLMEAFMPMPAAVRENAVKKASVADTSSIADLCGEHAKGPYLLVNTNLVLVNDEESSYRRRGGDSFVLSPIYCGGDAGGFVETALFGSGHMTLASAMTISGAAANPNSGWAGGGPTRLRTVSWLLALLNIRLGYWVRNPGARRRGAPGSLMYRVRRTLERIVGGDRPNHFALMGALLFSSSFRRGSNWFELSDGGHFENLAIYELVRRRVKLILVSDAGADPGSGFGDVQNTVRKVSEDFGVTVTFGAQFWSRAEYDKTNQRHSLETERAVRTGAERPRNVQGSTDHLLNRLSSLVPYRPAGFPVDCDITDHGYVIGTIEYPALADGTEAETGIIIYVKATMIGGLSLETRGYKADHPAFPHQSTADQFFDPAQFEAYRELGYAIGKDMIKGTRLADLLSLAWTEKAGSKKAPEVAPAPAPATV